MTRTADTRASDVHATTTLARLRGLRIVVTGGTSGLGRALVRLFAGEGARVALLARGLDGLRRMQEEAPGVHAIAADVGRRQDIYPAALQSTALLGGVDVLVNNASSLGPVPLRLLADTDCEDFGTALDTNVLGPFRLTRALLGALAASARDGRGAVVVNVSSDAAHSPYPTWGAYGASKAALHHMTRIWDEEARDDGIRFLSIDPGDMDTPLHAAAVPDADPSTLASPGLAARRIAEAIAAALPPVEDPRGHLRASAGEADGGVFALRGDADVAWGRA